MNAVLLVVVLFDWGVTALPPETMLNAGTAPVSQKVSSSWIERSFAELH